MDLTLQNDLWWGTDLRLPSWAGYQSRLGPYGSIDKAEPSDGSVSLIFAPEGRGAEPINKQEAEMISWFERNEQSVSAAVKAGIINWCSPQSQERASRFDFDDDFPVIACERDLKDNVGLYAINIHQVGTEGVPYIGYEFGCEWEEEHGLGVLMHGTRVVNIGFADTAFSLWIAEDTPAGTAAHAAQNLPENSATLLGRLPRSRRNLRRLPVLLGEVDRYCSWPGQACGYEVGHQEIVRQRTRAQTALGPRYDLRTFNDAVVLGGNVPLDVLSKNVDLYVDDARRG